MLLVYHYHHCTSVCNHLYLDVLQLLEYLLYHVNHLGMLLSLPHFLHYLMYLLTVYFVPLKFLEQSFVLLPSLHHP